MLNRIKEQYKNEISELQKQLSSLYTIMRACDPRIECYGFKTSMDVTSHQMVTAF